MSQTLRFSYISGLAAAHSFKRHACIDDMTGITAVLAMNSPITFKSHILLLYDSKCAMLLQYFVQIHEPFQSLSIAFASLHAVQTANFSPG